MIKTKVIRAISNNGTGTPNASSANTSLGFGHSTGVDPLPFMYEIKKQLKTKVSLNRKIHIMALPQCTPLNIVWSDAVSDAIPLNPGLSSKPSIFGSDIYFSYVFSTSVCITSLGAVVCGI